ncbi:glycosyl hydrolase [Actinoplanes sp. NBC_00393]|uniref:glycoside hydrolase family 26 protein n=1 Tax=Actinoplanes sp. NBC_00393 TaxID=2975953 RepID=UPI002E1E86BD
MPPSDRTRSRRGRALLAAAGAVVLAAGVALATRLGGDSDTETAAPQPSAAAATVSPTPSIAAPASPSAVPPAPVPTLMPVAEAVAAAKTKAGKRSARVQFSLPREAGSWPGKYGLSGVNGFPILNTASVESFCKARGRACNVTQTYTDRTSYESMTRGTGWTFDFFSGFDGVLVVSQGLVPNKGEDQLDDCAAGDYDQHWRDFGSLMVRHGRGDSVIRLGWEMNEESMGWRALDTKDYIACYRRAADAIRSTNPEVVLDWTINAHNTPDELCGGLTTSCYPGDEYVDIIGIDNYDHWPWSPAKADFDATADRQDGLNWLFSFARQHGKLFSVGEWGVMPFSDAKKDNPPFIEWMHGWFAEHAPYLAYEAYFQRCDGRTNQSSILRPNDTNCKADTSGSSDVYRSLYKS